MKEELIFILKGKEITLHRPKPLPADTETFLHKKRRDEVDALEQIIDGNFVLIKDFFSTGLMLLNVIKDYVKHLESDASFQKQRDFRKLYRELSHRILLRISNHKLSVRKSPEIGWLEMLYPDIDEFLLPFPQVQGLNSAWQWYEKGIKIPGLRDMIHPYYGVYFPTRFDHVGLFESWLKKYSEAKDVAIDVGVGSGVLSHMLLKYGFGKICCTDNNPNAIIGMLEQQENNKQFQAFDIFYGDLFAGCSEMADLIVFNPPWLPAIQNAEGLDGAIYYHEQLFPQFFQEAKTHLKPDGQLVLLFSNTVVNHSRIGLIVIQ